MTDSSTGQPLDLHFSEPIEVDGSYPFFLKLPGSADHLGTRAPVKVSGTLDGHRFDATLMPSGSGPHWLPLRAALRTAVGKQQPGDVVSVHLTARR